MNKKYAVDRIGSRNRRKEEQARDQKEHSDGEPEEVRKNGTTKAR